MVASLGEEGDLLGLRLREGQCHTADGSLSFVDPLLELMERHLCQVASVRFDAGFPEDRILSMLERRGTGYIARVRKNERLERLAEGHFGELKSVLQPALSSTRRRKRHDRGQEPAERTQSVDVFAMNETRLLLNALAYNLLHVQRTLLERQTRRGWSVQALCQWVLHQPARVLLHARQVTVVLPEAARRLWGHLSKTLDGLKLAATAEDGLSSTPPRTSWTVLWERCRSNRLPWREQGVSASPSG